MISYSLIKGKKKDKSNPNNYKDITVTFSLSQLFEKVTLSHIGNNLLDRHICFPHLLQFGFRIDHSATPACYVLKKNTGYYVSFRWNMA